ncbi:WGR domain-containing protein [Chamaesiphon minutus]|uniref:WGR domain-containing protein n=1 Tax=Chamaesiphon minutus TaxID=1173032 RepID=UPI0002F1F726|nr:WGR domain-containing protein [Chamaesiphon minutus]
MEWRSLRYTDDKSDKFWSILLSGCSHTVEYGRYGTDGQDQTKEFPTEAAARKSYEKLVAEKLKKGYVDDVKISPVTQAAYEQLGEQLNRGYVQDIRLPKFLLNKCYEKFARQLEREIAAGRISDPRTSYLEAVAAQLPVFMESYRTLLVEELQKIIDTRTFSTPVSVVNSTPSIDPPASTLTSSSIEPTPELASVPVIEQKQIELNTERSINLDPEDWYWATWRNLPPLPRPEPKPFDLQDCLKRLLKVTENWDWSKAKIAPSLSRAEAHFWCCAMAEPKTITNENNCTVWLKPKDIAERISNRVFDSNISHEQAKRACPPHSSFSRNYHLSEISPLINILTTEEFVKFVDNIEQKSLLIIVEGFRHYILPYLTQSQLESLRSYFSSRLDMTKWPTSGTYREVAVDFQLAAGLRLYDELLSLVESWNDDIFSDPYSYHHEPQEIIFGLKDAALVEKHFRRLGLNLNSTDRIRAWLAHTEYSALDIIQDTILDVWQKERAEQLLKTFALVRAPEAAPFMLELMLDSCVPQVARKWLQDNPAQRSRV